jgi:hypothetical protein
MIVSDYESGFHLLHPCVKTAPVSICRQLTELMVLHVIVIAGVVIIINSAAAAGSGALCPATTAMYSHCHTDWLQKQPIPSA